MAFPKEFQYANEDEFVQRLLIPLLHRLGFSVVANYHRTRGEFGKDLVFAEIDRFGHIRYCGLQAKYEESIGLKAVETLIDDCKQAFANTFEHPQTHTTERIQTFYAVNGGSISDDAVNHFFSSVALSLGPWAASCSRLLDGKALLALDRMVAANVAAAMRGVLSGLLLEIRYNRNMETFIRPSVEQVLQGQMDKIPTEVLRIDASTAYATRPSVPSDAFSIKVINYWHVARTVNRNLDLMLQAHLSGRRADNPPTIVLKALDDLKPRGDEIENEVLRMLAELGPLLPA